MKEQQINHNALTHLIEAGAVSTIIVKAAGDTWTLTVQVGDILKVVIAKNSGKPRVWRKLDTLAGYLKNLGIETFHIDLFKYDPSQKSLRRPDSANTLKQTHQSHQSLQQQMLDSAEKEPTSEPEPLFKTNIQPQSQTFEAGTATTAVKINSTDKAILLAKERWEHRRVKILQEENLKKESPKAK